MQLHKKWIVPINLIPLSSCSPLQSVDPVLPVSLLQTPLERFEVCHQKIHRSLRTTADLLQQQTWSSQDPQDRSVCQHMFPSLSPSVYFPWQYNTFYQMNQIFFSYVKFTTESSLRYSRNEVRVLNRVGVYRNPPTDVSHFFLLCSNLFALVVCSFCSQPWASTPRKWRRPLMTSWAWRGSTLTPTHSETCSASHHIFAA